MAILYLDLERDYTKKLSKELSKAKKRAQSAQIKQAEGMNPPALLFRKNRSYKEIFDYPNRICANEKRNQNDDDYKQAIAAALPPCHFCLMRYKGYLHHFGLIGIQSLLPPFSAVCKRRLAHGIVIVFLRYVATFCDF